jgi:uncharacterized membrane protein YheB (UPF0754 family)
MSFLPSELHTISQYAAPPLVGAFIGYLTNHIAIKMLFRPLRAWKICGVRVPMTPGVIPNKRLDLAKNMGEVVGDHLLTSDEIAKGLQNQAFQIHLQGIIREHIEELMQRDLGTIQTVIPEKFRIYFDIASKTVIYQVKEKIRFYLASEDFQRIAEQTFDQRLNRFLSSEVQTVVPGAQRELVYGLIEELFARLVHSRDLEDWAEDFVRQQIYEILQQQRTLHDLLPGAMEETLRDAFLAQTPALLERLAAMAAEPEVRERIVIGALEAVDSFILSMGPMGEMARGFLRKEQLEQKIRAYLVEKNDDITAWASSPDVQTRVVNIFASKYNELMQRPIQDFLADGEARKVEALCTGATHRLVATARRANLAPVIVSLVKNSCETRLEAGGISLQQAGELLLGQDALDKAKRQVRGELCAALRSPHALEMVDTLVDTFAAALLQKRIGKPGKLVPQGVREGVVASLQRVASAMLAREVPGLVASLNIKQIVTEKINSLDILKVEGLLLSIMQEHFKYINIFGALLGFLIGCGNLLLL